MSYNKPLLFIPNSTNITATFNRHCLMNADMIDLQASIHSTVVLINVFLYSGIGLILPTILIFMLSIILFQKGVHIWNELHSHHSETENISLRCDSPIVDYLRTYNAAFTLSIVFVFLSLPCKLLRLIVLFASYDTNEFLSTNQILLQAHEQMQTIGLAFELSLYSYKCFIIICTHYRFRCALKYLLTYHRTNIILDHRRSTIESHFSHKTIYERQSQASVVPFEGLHIHLQRNEFEPTISMYRTTNYNQRSTSYRIRTSICSRRTKDEELSV
ncbi:hypothetical protein I4U23_003205 [Adineta vaga]|nr:hypothetical protein I4U23_003205 [Adineta vaga]